MSSSAISSASASPIRKQPVSPNQDTSSSNKKQRTQTNPHQNFPPLGAASQHASVALLIRNVQAEQSHSDTSKTEAYSETIVDHDSGHDEIQSQSSPQSPISDKPSYGTGAIMSPIANIHTPGGSSRLIFKNESQAHITKKILGEGGDTSAYAAIFTSPGQTRYPAAAVYTTYPSKTIHSHPEKLGHLANIHLGNMDYVSLTLRGTTVEDAAKRIAPYPVPQKYKLAFLLTYFPTIVEKLLLIESAGRAHEDVKPSNLVIWAHTHAGPIDMRSLPKIGDRKRTFSKDFTSPSKQMVRPAASSSDVFATGRSISKGLNVFQSSFSEIPGLPELLADMEKPRASRPALAEVKARLETCLQDFKAINPDEYDAKITHVQELFFAQKI